MKLSRGASFWLLSGLLVLVLCAATAPSPLYGVYQELFDFPAITLTVIYAVYALGALVTLLTTGRLSDYIGRRRVLSLALIGQIVAMLVFVAANDVVDLVLARFLLGLATGTALGAIGAWLIDLEPPNRPGIGTLINGVGTLAGLGLGAFGAGLFVEYAPDPTHLVFWVLASAYALAVVAITVIPDQVRHRAGWVATLGPTVSVPGQARAMFSAAAPGLVGTFALAGLYLSLGPSLALLLLDSDNRAAGALVILALIAPGVAAAVALRSHDPGWVVVRTSSILLAGVGITVLGVWIGSVAILYGGSVIAGIGFGPALSAFLRTVVPLARPDERGALLSATYVVVFLSFSIPAVVAGAATTIYGLRSTTIGYGMTVLVLAAVTTIAVSRRLSSLQRVAP